MRFYLSNVIGNVQFPPTNSTVQKDPNNLKTFLEGEAVRVVYKKHTVSTVFSIVQLSQRMLDLSTTSKYANSTIFILFLF